MTLQLSIDVGASITKAVYSIDDGEQHFMKMESECIYVPLEIIEGISNIHTALPEDSAWISHSKKKGAQVCLLGLVAKQVQTRKSLKEAKYKTVVDKTLGIIGAISLTHELDCKNLEIELSFLIPFDEFLSRKIFIPSFEPRLRKFYFKGQEICSKLLKFECYPEGYGGLIDFAVNNGGKSWLNRRTIVVLMFGHRNCSFLRFERGNFAEGDTLNLGFYNFLESIKNYGIAQNIEMLEQIIPLIGNNLNPENELFYALTSGRTGKERQKEINELITVIQNMKLRNWISMRNWLEAKMPKIIDEIIVLGGASRYFLEEIRGLCSWTNVYFADELASEVNKKFPSKLRLSNSGVDHNNNNNNILSVRFADIFGFNKYLKNSKNLS